MAKRPIIKKKIKATAANGCPINTITLTSMKAFHRSVDWSEWWEEFYRSIGPDGLPVFKTVGSFCQSKAKNGLQKEFMKFYLGPVIENDPLRQKFGFVVPQHWADKRDMGASRAILEMAKQFRKKEFALEAIREAGNGVTAKVFYSLDVLNTKLDEAFQYNLFAPGRTESDNWKRAEKYLDLKHKLIGMIGVSQDQLAKSLGINYDNMEGFGALLAASAQSQHSNSAATNRLAGVMEDLVTMVALKKQKFPNHVEMPADLENKLLESANKPKVKTQ